MKRNSLLLMGLLCVASAGAATLSPEAALRRALHTPEGMQRLAGTSTPELKITVTAQEMQRAVPIYVFSTDEKAFIVAGSDLGTALLAVLDNPVYDSSMPPAAEYMLESYSRQLTAAEEAGLKAPTRAEEYFPDRIEIEPLLYTRWTQDSPYNKMCPQFQSGQAAVGCVATAMVQVMHYHQWPKEIPDNQITYNYSPNGGWFGEAQQRIEENIGGPIEWDLILDSYERGFRPENTAAVASLCYRVAVAMQMEFGSVASGSQTIWIPSNMSRYLSYDAGMYIYYRDLTDRGTYENKLYCELAAGRPVLYAGHGGITGHQFVCDGYQNPGMFHINWGWGGVSDGYYKFEAMEPAQQGTGGGGSFTEWQDFIVGTRPAIEGEESVIPVHMAVSAAPGASGSYATVGKFRVSNTEYTREEGTIVNFPFYALNTSPSAANVITALEFVDMATGESIFIDSFKEKTTLASLASTTGLFQFYAKDFPQEGRYKVYPASFARGQYNRLIYSAQITGPLEMTCTPETITFATEEGVPDLTWELPDYDLSLSMITIDMEQGEEMILTCSVGAEGADAGMLEWASANKRIAATEGSGESCIIRAVSGGTTKVRATLNGDIVECTVNVTGVENNDDGGEQTGEEEEEGNTDSVAELGATKNTPVYYNLQGMRVSNPRGGVYILTGCGAPRRVVMP